jgi:predicted nucleotidyltransferase
MKTVPAETTAMNRPKALEPAPEAASVSLREIREVADRIVREISPRQIILFGSAARGQATPDSDVDLLVITDPPAGRDASLRLRRKIDYSFALDLIVCDARRLAKRIDDGDFFLQDAVRYGKVLYERPDR